MEPGKVFVAFSGYTNMNTSQVQSASSFCKDKMMGSLAGVVSYERLYGFANVFPDNVTAINAGLYDPDNNGIFATPEGCITLTYIKINLINLSFSCDCVHLKY
jgi:hypothetical protein